MLIAKLSAIGLIARATMMSAARMKNDTPPISSPTMFSAHASPSAAIYQLISFASPIIACRHDFG